MQIDKICLEIKKEYSAIGPDSISDAIQAHDFVYQTIGKKTVENFEVIFMNYDYAPISFSIIGIGDDSKTNIDIGEIFKTALLLNARHILIAHNHLGSSVQPTDSDIETTRKIGHIGNLLNIHLIDSVIINANGDYLSIRLDVLKKAENELE